MFGPPTPLPAHRRHRHILPPTWAHYKSDISHTPPFPMDTLDHFPSHNPFEPETTPPDLPSRVVALNRRAATVAKNLEHLTAVVKPLESVKAADLSQSYLYDMHQEGVNLIEALHAFEEQTLEVLGVLGELLRSRREREREVRVEEWESWETGGGRSRGGRGRRVLK